MMIDPNVVARNAKRWFAGGVAQRIVAAIRATKTGLYEARLRFTSFAYIPSNRLGSQPTRSAEARSFSRARF